MPRKDRYKTHVEPFLDQIPKLYETMTEGQIARQLGVSSTTFEKYKAQHPELLAALQTARSGLIEDLKESLKKKAKGFHYTETKKTMRVVDGVQTKVIEEYERYSPPDTGAIHLLLKNLDDTWRNDDKATLDLKREKLAIDKQRADENGW